MKLTYITHESFIDHSYTIAKELKKHTDIKVFIQAKKLSSEIEEWCNELDAKFIKRLRFRNPASFVREVQNLKKFKNTGADVYWFNTLTAYQTLLLNKFIKKPFIMLHDIEIHPYIGDRYVIYAQKSTLKKYTRFVATASNTQADIFKNKCGIVPNVFRLPIIDYYTSVAGSANVYNTRKADELNKTTRFFFFGGIEQYKGIETLLDAVNILNQRNTNFEVNIYGKIKTGYQIISERINKIKNVNLSDKFINYKDIYKIYRDNDVLILPYKQVTQCGPLLIGYNQNIPAICSDLPGFREYVDDGKSGWLFSNIPEDLANKMEAILKDTNLVSEARNYISTEIKNKFSMSKLYKDYLRDLQS